MRATKSQFQIITYLFLLVSYFFISSCLSTEKQKTQIQDINPPSSDSITLMSFNVENLFDTKKDPHKDDSTYLPIDLKKNKYHKKKCKKIKRKKWRNQCIHWDWNESVLEEKLKRIAHSITQIKSPIGPDILCLQEIENLNVLNQLNNNYLNSSNYTPLLIEGNDARGIDVAFLTRLKIINKPILHPIAFDSISKKVLRDTRGILESHFKLPNGDTLIGFCVHFPAPFHPQYFREQALAFLNQLLKDRLKQTPYVFAAGDFNITSTEDSKFQVHKKLISPHWVSAEKIGCKNCLGTNYYPPKKEWSFLDKILLSKNFMNPNDWTVIVESIQIANQGPHQSTNKNTPAAFEPKEPTGVSDHWPLILTISNSH